ncbi:MAG: hypothetical protein RLW68_00790 [Devosia marina]|uniref:hypothetical protein n=1 Tax=Devosia marina TaxID=2683198 RepID=UPI0032EFA7F1
MPIVRMPDGAQVRFPDDMPPEQIKSMIQQKFPDAGKQFNPIEAAQGGIMQGMTFGFNDEIQAGMMTPIEMGLDLVQGKGWDPGRSFGQALDKTRGTEAMMQEQQPLAHTIGNITGGVGSGVGLARGGATLMAGAKPTVASMGGRGAVEGAIYGGLHGLGTGTDDKVGSAIEGALIGGATGGVLGGVGGAVASRSAQSAMPSVQNLKDEAGVLYDAARQSGAMLPQAQSANMANKVRSIASAEGIVTPTGRINDSFPRVADLVRSFDDYGTGDLSIDQMQSVRKLIQSALKSPDSDERRIAMMVMDEFHRFLDPIAPEIAQANQIYHRAMNADVLETLVEIAQQKSGQYGRSLDATLREQFGALERQIIKGEVRGFSDAEKAAISKVAQGGTIEGILTLIGKAAPSGIVSGAAGFGVPFAVGNAVGGPVAGTAAGLGTLGAGMAARQGANAMTGNSARNAVAQALMANTPRPGANPAISPIVQALIAGGGSQAPEVNPAIARALALN